MASTPFKVKAVYEYSSAEPDDLNFPNGQIITVTEEEDADWYVGEYIDQNGAKKDGLFPKNFVEKYEPAVPSRPTRAPRPKSGVQPPPPVAAPAQEPEPEEETAPALPTQSKPQPPLVQIPATSSREESIRSPPSATGQQTPVPRDEPPPAPKPALVEPAASATKGPPPPVTSKPAGNSFRDRIAAFNNQGAAPITPFKASGAAPSSFIKKPYVAPPPSKNAYIPPPRAEPVQKAYRRDEDPEIKERQAEDADAAKAAGLSTDTPVPAQAEAPGEDEPKPMTLKERMALLQKEQQEQATRRAEASHKKAAPRPPSKKRTESSDRLPNAEQAEGANLERVRSGEETERQSLDAPRERPRVPSSQRQPREPMSPVVQTQEPEIFSDGNEADQSAAGEETEDNEGPSGLEDTDEMPSAAAASHPEPEQSDDEDTAEEEDDMDDETRRKLELRERMAKMSGGMGMGAMFGPPGGMPVPGGMPPKKKATKDREVAPTEDSAASSPPQTQRIPMIPVPGMQRMRTSQAEEAPTVGHEEEPEAPITGERGPETVPDVEDLKPEPPPRASMENRDAPPRLPRERPVPQSPQERGAPPPVPGERPAPRPPQAESRQVPPPPPGAMPLSPSAGSESDDEMSLHARQSSAEAAETPMPIRGGAPPVPASREVPPRPQGPRSPQSPDVKRASYFGGDSSGPGSGSSDRRSSRVPPIPMGSPMMSPGGIRPPPPPPPTAAPPSRQSTDLAPPPRAPLQDEDRGESEYEGDYDTDIASGATHKDALKSHAREPSLNESTTTDDTPPGSARQLPPQAPVPRAVPPPPPQTKQSMDAPRSPPPMPPPRDVGSMDDDDYDPYKYSESSRPVPPLPTGAIGMPTAPPPPPRESATTHEDSSDDMYSASPPRRSMEPQSMPPQPPSQDRAVPPPPTQQAPAPGRAMPRQSLDVARQPTLSRRSMDQNRPSGEHGMIAGDVDLGERTGWWTQAQPLPPVFQQRNGVDLLFECEESSTSKRGGKTTIVKDVYVLFIDYSQTVITVRYDSRETSDAGFEQRHEPPPPRLRQDQLEGYWQRFGAKMAEAAQAIKKDATVGDGSPNTLVREVIKAQRDALQPVGTRAYGALVYANLANASVQQFDEIRPGDVITLRNAKLQGKHGPMHQKYSQDIGMGAGHVGIVVDWDGTKKKVRAWEQGREKSKVRIESFRLGDLRSGEVRVWRVVGREWVGWDGNT